MRQSLIILGSGYTAKALLPLARERYVQVLATSRDPEQHLSHLRPEQQIQFDLERSETWANIPRDGDLLWCFPAVPLNLVQKFAETAALATRRLVVLGSTSAYDADESPAYPPPWIDETAAIDLTKPRVQGEEWLRTSCGALVLRVAGIYGPGRNPIDWIRTGRVRPSRKYVNLIHVEDLATACLAALMHAQPSEVYNVSDGTPRTWNEICEQVGRSGQSVEVDASVPPGKRISNVRLLDLLRLNGRDLRHPDVLKALTTL